MNGQDNLIPMSERTKEEQREIARQGGIKSGEARREKKAMKDAINLLLSQPCNLKDKNKKSFKSIAKQYGIKEEDVDNQMAIIISMFNVAMSGNKNSVSAATFLRDTAGEKPVEKVELNKSIDETIKEIDDYICQKKQ